MENKKAQFSARSYVIGIILFSAIISLAYLMVQSGADNYNEDVVNSALMEHYNQLDNTTKMASDIFETVKKDENFNIIQGAEIFFR